MPYVAVDRADTHRNRAHKTQWRLRRPTQGGAAGSGDDDSTPTPAESAKPAPAPGPAAESSSEAATEKSKSVRGEEASKERAAQMAAQNEEHIAAIVSLIREQCVH